MVLAPGCCFTIEPMINMGGHKIDMTDPNGWTVRTADRKPSAQWKCSWWSRKPAMSLSW